MPIVREIGRPASQVALNWLRQQPGVVIPIFSARTASQMKEDLACLDFTLTAGQIQRIDQATERALATPIVKWGDPNDFLEYGSPAIPDFEVKKMEYGTVGEFIDNHRATARREPVRAAAPAPEPAGVAR